MKDLKVKNENGQEEVLRVEDKKVPHYASKVTSKKTPIKEGMGVMFNLEYEPDKGYTNVGETETVPNGAVTVRQILSRNARGIKTEEKEPLYFDFQIPKITDITDVYNYSNHLEEQVRIAKAWIAERENEKREEEEQKRLKRERDLLREEIKNDGIEPSKP